MTRRIDEHVHHDTTEDQYTKRHQFRPKSLAEQDAEWERQERIQAQSERRHAELARKRVSA